MNTDNPNPDLADEIVAAVLVEARRFWVEAAMVAAVGATYWATERRIGTIVAATAVAVTVGVLLAARRVRRALGNLLVCRHWRRRLERALARLAGRSFAGQAPALRQVTRTPFGITATVRLRPGHAATEVEKAAEALAAALRVTHIHVERDHSDAGVCCLTVTCRDPFACGPIPCPWTHARSVDLWEPLPIGHDQYGQRVHLAVAGHHLLAGGAPGGGKSNLLQLVAAAAALDPAASLHALDPKVVELARWQPLAASWAGADIGDALVVLRHLDSELGRRYQLLAERRLRKLTAADGVGLHVVVVDEAMIYLNDPDKAAAAEFARLLRKLVALGRAAGIVVVVGTQKPSTDVIPSAIRDNMSVRAAFRCTTRDASDTILGSGWATNNISAADIDPTQPGVCYLLHEAAEPTKIRCYHLTDGDLDTIAAHTHQDRP